MALIAKKTPPLGLTSLVQMTIKGAALSGVSQTKKYGCTVENRQKGLILLSFVTGTDPAGAQRDYLNISEAGNESVGGNRE